MPIAPTENSLPRNKTATVLQPFCRTHYYGLTIVSLLCVSRQNN